MTDLPPLSELPAGIRSRDVEGINGLWLDFLAGLPSD